MKRILLLLLFNLSIVAAFSQANTYHKSTHIINSDSTHGELDGTEYRNAAGLFRYKENGTWYYRLSTAGANAAFVKLTGNETISGIKTFSTPIAVGSGGTGLSSIGSALQILRVNSAGTALEYAASSAGSPGGSASSIQINNGASGFNGLNMAVGTNSLYNLVAGQNWHLGWNASGSGGNVDARRLSITTLGVAIGSLTDAVTPLHVEKTISGVSGNVVGEALRLRSDFSSATPAAGAGTRMDFETETSVGNYELGAAIEAVTTDVTSSSEDFDLVFKNMAGGATAAERVRMTSTGYLGVGTSTPFAPLAFANSTGRKIMLYGSDNDHQYFGISLDAPSDLFQSRISTTIGSYVWYAATSSTTSNELMRLTGTGILSLTSTDATAASKFVLTAPIARSEIASTGTTGPFYRLSRTGSPAATWDVKIDVGTTDFSIQEAGGVSGIEYLFNTAGTATGVDWVATSDRRLKYNFKSVGSQLGKIRDVAALVTNYDRKDNGKNETGFIAQELLKVAPEYVTVPIDTTAGYYAVSYAKMTPILFKGVDQLNNEVEALRQEVAELKSIIKEYRRITLEASTK